MRFIANGPSIPDELLLARDEGRVVFFCGAGVSRAKAKLPDFFGLAAAVTHALGVPEDDPARQIIAEAQEISKRTGIDGLISADRIFGLLERSFLPRDIQEAVAKELARKRTPDLSAHQTLLKLATTRENLVRLVTTNFDRLFDHCRPKLPTYTPPNLPNPSRAAEFSGIVYLHGKINAEGNGAEGDGLILSSSDFGRAYLADGWATEFVREILNRYLVVFVGYSADDPPVQYLLEALRRTSGSRKGIYAFQSGDANYANSRWHHKGVIAIPYDGANDHAALWDSLAAWAIRADDPDAWTANVIELAKLGPEKLQPHERGQVAHVVSTLEGLRKFSQVDNPPPATWLCVFDPYQRYAKPGKQGGFGGDRPFIDPFDRYSLDSDPAPNKIDPENFYAKREVPRGAWDAFALNKLDRIGLRGENVAAIRGYWSSQLPRLPARQYQLGVWLSRVAGQPEAVWWAARQTALHPDICKLITIQLERAKNETSPAVRQAWRYLLEFWSAVRNEDLEWYGLASELRKDGWSEIVLRTFANISRPYIKVEESLWSGPAPAIKEDYDLRDLISLSVEYPELPQDISVPDEWLARVIVVLRRNLEVALELETEVGGYALHNISPITPDERADGDSYSRNHGLSGWVLYFVKQMERLTLLDPKAAKTEFLKWPENDATIFARLRIWALRRSDQVSQEEFDVYFGTLPDEAFWSSHHARDLLLTLSTRWNELKPETRSRIEQRILNGPKPLEGEEDSEFTRRKASFILNRLYWLRQHGCVLQLDLDKLTEKLREDAPDWKPAYAKDAARSLEGRVGWVRTDTDYSALLSETLDATLSKAKELSSRRLEFVQHDPFAGLSEKRPLRAFAALRLAAKRKEFPEWAWRAFLDPERRKCDRLRFTAFIAEQIARYPARAVARIIRPLAYWIQKTAKPLATKYPNIFARLISKTIGALSLQTPESTTAIVRSSREIDWVMEAINSPTGQIAEALFGDPQIQRLTRQRGFPKRWLRHVERLLTLPDDLRRHALVILTHNLSWFFFVDPAWTRAKLLAVLLSNSSHDQQAFWAGFLWGGKVDGRELFTILKPHMLQLAKAGDFERLGYGENLAGLLLSAWTLVDEDTGERWVTNEELRDVLLNTNDDVRCHVLWQAEHWVRKERERWLPLLLDLLRNVWPRQTAARSAVVSVKLCDIAFADEERFPELAAAVLPLLTKSDGARLMLPNLHRFHDNIVDLYPRETLALLHAVLPDDVSAWPYGIDGTITRIGAADSLLNSDERLIELKRKWNAR